MEDTREEPCFYPCSCNAGHFNESHHGYPDTREELPVAPGTPSYRS